MFGWFKRKKPSTGSPFVEPEKIVDNARVVMRATGGGVAAMNVVGPIHMSPGRVTVAKPKPKPVYTPGGSLAGTYSAPSYDFTPAYVAAAASGWDAGSSSSSCDSSSSGCGGGGCGGGC